MREYTKGLIDTLSIMMYDDYKEGKSTEEISKEYGLPKLIVEHEVRKEEAKEITEQKNLEGRGEKTMNELIKAVEQWSKDKGLENGNPDRQALKFYEEAGEVGAALSRNNMEDLKDGIGDTIVTLIILAQQHDMTVEECLEYAYNEIKGRKGKTVNGTFIKEEDL